MAISVAEFPARQQPDWPDQGHVIDVVAELETRDPLVSPDEINQLTAELGKVVAGEAYALHEGPCAELLSDSPRRVIRDALNVILPQTVLLEYSAGVPAVKIGRFGGQFAKPRSSATEIRDGLVLPSYFGDIVNDAEFTEAARTPNPDRMLQVYDHSAETIKAVRELTTGGFADLERMHNWNVRFAKNGSGRERERYQEVAQDISKALRYIKACGIDLASLPDLHEASMYVSHEALLLVYEQALTREHEDGKDYDTSAHMVWIGDRTRDPEEAHVAFCENIANPIGLKLGPTAKVGDVIELCERLNPHEIPGKLTLISRMGVGNIHAILPPIMKAVKKSGSPVIWSCDPMHGNTIATSDGVKTREFTTISQELESFFEICREVGVWPGGVHLEITGDNVTECRGGSSPAVDNLLLRYKTACDPRLNPSQSIELAFKIADMLDPKSH